jgi:hypothetical protein
VGKQGLLLTDKRILEIEDFGAGSSVAETNLPDGQAGRRSIASIDKHAAKSKKWGRLLFRIVKYFPVYCTFRYIHKNSSES